MPAYLLTLPAGQCGATYTDGVNSLVVFAASDTIAKQMANTKYGEQGSLWTGATATEIVAGTNWLGWTFEITLHSGIGAGKAFPAVVSVTSAGANDTMDEIAALLVTDLNALDGIAGATYDAATNILTVAAIADGIGDKTFAVRIVPPGGFKAVAGLVGTIVSGGVAAAALTVVLPADNAVIPSVTAP